MRLAQLPAAPVEAPAKRKLTKSAARAVVEQIMAKAPVAAEPVAAVEAPKAEPVAIVAPVEPQVAAPKAPKTPRAPKAPQADALMLLCVTYIEQVWASAANKDVAPPVITTETVRDALLELPAAKPLLADKPGDKVWGALSRLRRANLISWSWARPRVRSYGPLAR
jgi:transposase InsO family protein